MSKCKGCGAEIIWSRTTNGKPMPLDPKPEQRSVLVSRNLDGEMVVKSVPTYLPHWATCPDAARFKKGQ